MQIYNADIVCITETKIDSNFDDNELLGDTYTVYRNDRKQGGGGVLVAIKNSSTVKLIKNSKGHGESIISTISFSPQITFDLITYYRPPSETHLDTLNSMFNDRTSRYPLVAVGDFNLPDIGWSSGTGKVKEVSGRHLFHQDALDIFNSFNLTQLVRGPTHKKGNTLDLFLVETVLFDCLSFECELLPGISDHDMLLVEISTQNTGTEKKPIVINTKNKYNFKRANYEGIRNLFFELLSRLNRIPCPAEMQWQLFRDTLKQGLVEFVPILLPRPKGKPWMTRSLLRTIRKRDRVYRVVRQHPSSENLFHLEHLKQKVKYEVRAAKSNFIEHHITGELENRNTKPLYNLISKSRGQSNHISCLENVSQEDIANSFAIFFSSVFNNDTLGVPDFELDMPQLMEMPRICITIEGVSNLIQKLDVRKSTGPDDISPYCLKEFSVNVPEVVQCLALVLQSSLNQSAIPHDWRTANVVPIFKKGRRDLSQNYRPISLTSIVSKIIEHIIVSSMWRHIDNYDLVTKHQHGFRKRFSTTTQLLDVIYHTSKAMANRRAYHLISFDFAKAFDKVPHHLLVHKLIAYKFDKDVIGWIRHWLADRTSRVLVNGTMSHEFNVTSGVPQGSVLGPLLFLIFINDMPLCLKNSHCWLYADDTFLGMDVTECGAIQLQKNVTALYDWSLKWGMSFNPTKCIHMELGKDLPDFTLYMNNTPIPQSNSLKYLGVHIQSDLKWQQHTLNIIKQSNKCLGMIRRCLFNASSKTKMLAFNTVVRPVLEYASQVWSPHTKGLQDKLETIQRRAVRWAFRLEPLDSVTECMTSNDVVVLGARRQELDLNFLRRVEFGLYEVDLSTYISFNESHFTRHGTINPHFVLDQFKYSFYNRMRPFIKGREPEPL